MPVPHTFSAVTKAKSSQINANFEYITDLIDSTGSPDFLITDSGGVKNAYIEGTVSSGLNIIGNAGNAGIEVRAVGGTAYLDFSNDSSTDYDARLYLASNDVLAVRGADLTISEGKALNTADSTGTYTSSVYTETTGNIIINPSADGNVVGLGRTPRKYQSTTTYVQRTLFSVSGYIAGDGSASIGGLFDLPVTVANTNYICMPNFSGGMAGTPTAEGSAGYTTIANDIIVNAHPYSTTQVYVVMRHQSSTFGVGTNYTFHVGILATPT